MNKSDYYYGLCTRLREIELSLKSILPHQERRGRPSAGEVVKNFDYSVSGFTTIVKCPLSTRQPFLYGLAKTHKKKITI